MDSGWGVRFRSSETKRSKPILGLAIIFHGAAFLYAFDIFYLMSSGIYVQTAHFCWFDSGSMLTMCTYTEAAECAQR